LVAYLNWSFETSFWKYLASALVFYLLLIAIFALLIILSVLVGVNEATPQDDSTCFENLIAGKDFDNLYSSAFTLSWTTFSTVVSETECNIDLKSLQCKTTKKCLNEFMKMHLLGLRSNLSEA